MAGTRISFSVEDQVAREMLARQALPPIDNLMHRLGSRLKDLTEARFTTQTAPDGTPWAPLRPAYAKRKKYNKDKVLTLRGYLRSGIRYQVESGDTVAVGTNAVQGAIHQFGGTIKQLAQSRKTRYRSVAGRVLFAGAKHKRGVTERWVERGAYQVKIPARPFLGISATDDAEIRSIIMDWVVERSQG